MPLGTGKLMTSAEAGYVVGREEEKRKREAQGGVERKVPQDVARKLVHRELRHRHARLSSKATPLSVFYFTFSLHM